MLLSCLCGRSQKIYFPSFVLSSFIWRTFHYPGLWDVHKKILFYVWGRWGHLPLPSCSTATELFMYIYLSSKLIKEITQITRALRALDKNHLNYAVIPSRDICNTFKVGQSIRKYKWPHLFFIAISYEQVNLFAFVYVSTNGGLKMDVIDCNKRRLPYFFNENSQCMACCRQLCNTCGPFNCVDKLKMADGLIRLNEMQTFHTCLTLDGNVNDIFWGMAHILKSCSCVSHLENNKGTCLATFGN